MDRISRAVESLYALHARAAVPLTCIYVSIVSQLFFSIARTSIKMDIELSQNPREKLRERNIYIVAFLSFEALQTMINLYLSLRYRWCLLSTAYSLGHFVWTALSYRNEYLYDDGYLSIDGWIRFRQQ